MRIGGQKSKQVSKRQENNSKYTEMEKKSVIVCINTAASAA